MQQLNLCDETIVCWFLGFFFFFNFFAKENSKFNYTSILFFELLLIVVNSSNNRIWKLFGEENFPSKDKGKIPFYDSMEKRFSRISIDRIDRRSCFFRRTIIIRLIRNVTIFVIVSILREPKLFQIIDQRT